MIKYYIISRKKFNKVEFLSFNQNGDQVWLAHPTKAKRYMIHEQAKQDFESLKKCSPAISFSISEFLMQTRTDEVMG